MDLPLSSAPILKPDAAVGGDGEGASGREGLSSCPLCGDARAQEWLRAPDRFHGRSERYVLVRCSGCSLVWLSNPPSAEQMRHHYTDSYHRLISVAGESSPHRWRSHREALLQHKQSGALLDLGCSSGAFLEFLKGERWKLYGVEMSAECAKRASAKTGAEVFEGDILNAPFSAESFDVITCFDVLEHLYEPLQVVTKVRKWLKPGGIFYVQVPNVDAAEARVFRSYWHGLELPRHLFHYSPNSLKFLANSAGLREVSVQTRRNPAVGTSLRYVGDDVFGAAGIRRTPVAYRREAGLPWRAARKIIRLTVLRGLLAMAPLVGEGESIHAIFQKRM